MKKSITAFAAILLLISSVSFSQGLNSISTADGINVVAAGNAGNLFRSTNSGTTWAKYTNGSADLKCVTSFNDNIWIAADGGNVLKTSKFPGVITSVNVGVTSSLNSVTFINDNLGFVCGAMSGIYKSVTGGSGWTLTNSGITAGQKLNSISFADANNGFVVGDNGVAYKTVNGGALWTQITFPFSMSKNLLSVKYFTDGVIIAGEYGTLIKIPNSSLTPVLIDMQTISDVRSVSGISMVNNVICGGGGFIRTNAVIPDYNSFQQNPMLANLVDICFVGSTGYAVSSLNNAIIKTTNSGTTWTLTAGTTMTFNWVSKPTATGNFLGNNICQHPTNPNTIFSVFGATVFVSRNKGETWANISNVGVGNTPHDLYISPIDTNIWLVATESSTDCIMRTSNYGQTWTNVLAINFSNYGEPLQIDQNNPSTFYFAPDNGGFWKSTNSGANWTSISSYPFRSPCDIAVEYGNSNVILVGDGITSNGKADLLKSTNGGINWTIMNTNPTVGSGSEIPSICNTQFDPKLYWYTEWSGSNIYKSTNGGNNFVIDHVNSGISGWGSDIAHDDPTVLITGSWGASARISTDAGSTWTTISTGLAGHGGGINYFERGYAVISQGTNIYKLNISYNVVTDINITSSASLPERFELKQNYPNPFNPATNIEFDVPASGNVSLKIFDAVGKEVYTLVNGFKNAGNYNVNFNASSMNSGVYFYMLEAGNSVITKKMMLVK
ncbi:hypothetical protein BH10BAC5_BH10BAC5_00460 [soil metagenome]